MWTVIFLIAFIASVILAVSFDNKGYFGWYMVFIVVAIVSVIGLGVSITYYISVSDYQIGLSSIYYQDRRNNI